MNGNQQTPKYQTNSMSTQQEWFTADIEWPFYKIVANNQAIQFTQAYKVWGVKAHSFQYSNSDFEPVLYNGP